MTPAPSAASVITTARTDLILLDAETLAALAGARWADAAARSGIAIPSIDAAGDVRNFARRRDDVLRAPADATWYLRAIVLRDTRLMAGRISFHGPPEDGVAELGYSVFPPLRRRGLAREAAEAMMAWAHREHGVGRFRLSIGDWNTPSLSMAAAMGFTRRGEQMDPEDGLEFVFERQYDMPE